MSPKELTKLTVSDLFEGFNRDFWNYWEIYDDAARVFKNKMTEDGLEPGLGRLTSYYPPISNTTKGLDAELAVFHKRILENRYEYLFLDGVALKIRTGFGTRKRVVLAVYGIRFDRREELIDFIVTNCESREVWEGFLNNIYGRGLTGDGLELVIIDGNDGLASAIRTIFPQVGRQRCWSHKLRNVSNYIREKDRDKCIKEMQTIYDASGREDAIESYHKWTGKWKNIYPEVVRSVEKDLDELMSFFCCPQEIRVKLRTTGVIESAFKEVRKRTGPMSCFNSNQSIERVVYAVIRRRNDGWHQ